LLAKSFVADYHPVKSTHYYHCSQYSLYYTASLITVSSEATSTANAEEQQDDEDIWWGGIRGIQPQKLIQLAVKHLGETHGSTCSVLESLEGSYNRAHIMQFANGTKVVIRVPACGTPERWTEEDAFAIRSQALTMNYIKRHTNLPIPHVIAYSNTCDNDLGHPYILTDFMPGANVSEAWGEGADYGPNLEKKRQRILCSLAHAMSKLQTLSFDASGSLHFEQDLDDNPHVGPRFTVDENYPHRRTYLETPYNNSRQHIRDRLAKWWGEAKNDCEPHSADFFKVNGMFKTLQIAIDCLPNPEPKTNDGAGLKAESIDEQSDTSETFVLALPDFDYQNILVDDEGNITGLLDWDEVSTVPRYTGFTSSPLWITRDYTDSRYEWDGEIGNSDWHLARYRRMYSQYMYEAMKGQGDSKFTAKSHLFQALQYACNWENKMSWPTVKNFLSLILGRTELSYYIVRLGNEEHGFKPGEEEWLRERMVELFDCRPGSEDFLHI
jgi:hypothetical protein